jgi:hypothetical protein
LMLAIRKPRWFEVFGVERDAMDIAVTLHRRASQIEANEHRHHALRERVAPVEVTSIAVLRAGPNGLIVGLVLKPRRVGQQSLPKMVLPGKEQTNAADDPLSIVAREFLSGSAGVAGCPGILTHGAQPVTILFRRVSRRAWN